MAGAIKKEHQAKILSETTNLISLEDPAPGPGVLGKAREEVYEEVWKEGGAEGKVGLKEQEGVQRVKACGLQVHHHVWPQRVWNMYSGRGFAAVRGVGDGSHGLEHGISDLCQGQFLGPSSDGGAGEGSFPDKEAICVVYIG